MFRMAIAAASGRLAEAIDDMLLGDFAYVRDGDRLYADVDLLHLRSERSPRQSATRSAARCQPERMARAGRLRRPDMAAAGHGGACLPAAHAPTQPGPHRLAGG